MTRLFIYIFYKNLIKIYRVDFEKLFCRFSNRITSNPGTFNNFTNNKFFRVHEKLHFSKNVTTELKIDFRRLQRFLRGYTIYVKKLTHTKQTDSSQQHFFFNSEGVKNGYRSCYIDIQTGCKGFQFQRKFIKLLEINTKSMKFLINIVSHKLFTD